jgi:hypothetical protein
VKVAYRSLIAEIARAAGGGSRVRDKLEVMSSLPTGQDFGLA